LGLAPIENILINLQNFDTDTIIPSADTDVNFFLEGPIRDESGLLSLTMFDVLCRSWEQYNQRTKTSEAQWIAGLAAHLEHLINLRLSHVQDWITENIARFTSTASSRIDPLRLEFETLVTNLRAAVQLCAMKCNTCHLSCLQSRNHAGLHNCATDHTCVHPCKYQDDHDGDKVCGLPYVFL
jgi:hypothetical protein